MEFVGMKETARKSTTMARDGEEGGECHSVCRVCLCGRQQSRLMSLFLHWTPPWKQERSTDDCIASQLAKLAGTRIEQADGFPQQICYSCFASFKEAYTFYYKVRHHDNVMRSDQLLVQTSSLSMSDLMETWQKPLGDEDRAGETGPLPDTYEIKQEVLSDTEGREAKLDLEIKQEIKIEPEELISQTHRDARLNGLTEANNLPMSNIIISSSFSVDPISQAPRHVNRPSPIKNSFRATAPNVENTTTAVKTEALDSAEDSCDTDSDLPLDCMLCYKQFRTVSGLKAHVISSHSYKSVMKKANATVRTGSLMDDNANKETVCEQATADQSQLSCLDCGKTFTTDKSLQTHTRIHKTICERCNVYFDNFVTLARHMRDCELLVAGSANRTKTKTVQQLRRECIAEPIEKPIKRRKRTETKYECSHCKETFDEKIYLNIHNEAHHSMTVTDDVPRLEQSKSESAESAETSVKEEQHEDMLTSSDEDNHQNKEDNTMDADNLLDVLGSVKLSEETKTPNSNIITSDVDNKEPLVSLPGEHVTTDIMNYLDILTDEVNLMLESNIRGATPASTTKEKTDTSEKDISKAGLKNPHKTVENDAKISILQGPKEKESEIKLDGFSTQDLKRQITDSLY